MPSMYATNTNTLTTEDWLRVSKDMKLSSYDPDWGKTQANHSTPQQSAVFGTHVKEAVAIVKDWIEDCRK